MLPVEDDIFSFPLSETIAGTFATIFGAEWILSAYISTTANNNMKNFAYGLGAALVVGGGFVLSKNLNDYFRNMAILKNCKAKFGDTDHAIEVAERYISSGPLLGYKAKTHKP
ncbi:hypothetical protein HYU09_03520 [Candidatus Woesearchaeota archaeon]|nr:hypothetical protein [Candidatus Woesearchaeota archaeon]